MMKQMKEMEERSRKSNIQIKILKREQSNCKSHYQIIEKKITYKGRKSD